MGRIGICKGCRELETLNDDGFCIECINEKEMEKEIANGKVRNDSKQNQSVEEHME